MTSLANKIVAESYTRGVAMSRLAQERSSREEKAFVNKGKTKDVDFSKEFDKVQKEIESLPELIIYSALPLSDEQVCDLGKKSRKLFDKDLFIDVKIDLALLGGAALAWKGQYKDYSLKARFEEKKNILKGIYEQFSEDRRGRIRPES